jgi:protocatechuate 3,4-dioxygenase beta subunit
VRRVSRRDVLNRCLGAGLLVAVPPLTESTLLARWFDADSRRFKPTPPNELGPYYKPRAPHATNLVRPGDAGLPLSVSGSVLDTQGRPLPGAVIEIWHADPAGQYDNQGFHYRGQLAARDGGKYAFQTNLPGHYPQRVAQHIHYKVTAPDHATLITQLYFATDPAFEGDPDRNYLRDPILHYRDLIRPVTVYPTPESIHAAVEFEIVLKRL